MEEARLALLIKRAQRRLALTCLLRGAIEASLIYFSIVLVLLALSTLFGKSEMRGPLALLVPLALILAGAVRGWISAPSRLEAAKLIDNRCALKDRLGSALEAAPSRAEPFARALLADALARGVAVSLKEATPVKLPRSAGLLIPMLFLASILLHVIPEAMPSKPQAASWSEGLTERIEAFRREAEALGDKRTAALLSELKQLIEQLARGEIDAKELQARLAHLKSGIARSISGAAGGNQATEGSRSETPGDERQGERGSERAQGESGRSGRPQNAEGEGDGENADAPSRFERGRSGGGDRQQQLVSAAMSLLEKAEMLARNQPGGSAGKRESTGQLGENETSEGSGAESNRRQAGHSAAQNMGARGARDGAESEGNSGEKALAPGSEPGSKQAGPQTEIESSGQEEMLAGISECWLSTPALSGWSNRSNSATSSWPSGPR